MKETLHCLTVISMWRNLQTVRKQRPSCQRLQTVSLPNAASQCLNGQLSPCPEMTISETPATVKLFLLCDLGAASAYLSAGGIVKEEAVDAIVAHSAVREMEGMKF